MVNVALPTNINVSYTNSGTNVNITLQNLLNLLGRLNFELSQLQIAIKILADNTLPAIEKTHALQMVQRSINNHSKLVCLLLNNTNTTPPTNLSLTSADLTNLGVT